MSKFKLYARNVLIGIDQLGNAVIGGDPDETISSRVGRASMAGSRIARVLEFIIDALFWPVDGPGHCRANIEPLIPEREVIRL